MTGGREEERRRRKRKRGGGGGESVSVCEYSSFVTEWTEDSTSLGSKLEKVVEQTGD